MFLLFTDYINSECLLAENLEKLGMFVLSKEAEPSIGSNDIIYYLICTLIYTLKELSKASVYMG